MKYFIIATVIYFAYPLVFAMEDSCVTNCSATCLEQAQNAEVAIYSHRGVCSGREPLVTNPVCATACSSGCKAVMRGQTKLVIDHYDLCGGGDGNFGSLQCMETPSGVKIINTHSLDYIGNSFRNESKCQDAVDTLNYDILCAKSNSGFTVFNKLGMPLGVGSSQLYQCVETLMTVKNDRVCVKVAHNRYAAYDLISMKRVGPGHKFLSSCKGGR